MLRQTHYNLLYISVIVERGSELIEYDFLGKVYCLFLYICNIVSHCSCSTLVVVNHIERVNHHLYIYCLVVCTGQHSYGVKRSGVRRMVSKCVKANFNLCGSLIVDSLSGSEFQSFIAK